MDWVSAAYTAVALACAAAATVVALGHIYGHLLHYTEPIYQRFIVRVIFMVSKERTVPENCTNSVQNISVLPVSQCIAKFLWVRLLKSEKVIPSSELDGRGTAQSIGSFADDKIVVELCTAMKWNLLQRFGSRIYASASSLTEDPGPMRFHWSRSK